jgi:outer membrane protein assembly factor BamB
MLKAREPPMQSAQRITQRPFLFFLPLLLCQFLSVALSSCGSFQCEAMPPPSVIPRIFIADGRVYMFSAGSSLRVLQESSGKQLWQTSGQLEAVDTDQIYLSFSQGNTSFLEALRANDGKQLWQKTEDSATRVISAVHGSVYLYQETDARLVALNERDGTERWKNLIDLPLPASPGNGESGISVQVSSSVVYVRSASGQISAYQEESGSLLWSHTFPSSSSIAPEMPWEISEGVIYTANGINIYALRISDGKMLWQRGADTSFVLDSSGGMLLTLAIAASGTSLVALQAHDGKMLWQRSEPQIQLNSVGMSIGIKLIGSTLYIGRRGSAGGLPFGDQATYFATDVQAIRASDGMYLWQYQGEKSWDILAVEGTDATAYILSYDSQAPQPTATLTALRVSDGKHLWQHAAPAAGLTFADDALYTGYGGDGQTSGCTATGAAHIVKYRATDGQERWHVQP